MSKDTAVAIKDLKLALPPGGDRAYAVDGVSFDLTAGMLEINDQDKSKSTGVLYPLAQLAIDKQGQLQIELNENAWKLVDVLDWKGTPGVN